ncbi:hypothetical protein BU23DRAFT_557218 [Bimuria novae-zelandiae CBS 107.79]|uniref:Uncharacterized protein n=1 Tax=Bimuria novae-zelandiae CBS 107.79 TaxID=1447943 RepID=A0A6A5V4U4_9PLEO|nr:hypothetical protein BU23DRAFT_557218 [Bimuria novae-zelandiae CBS 107.79]
MPRGGHKTKSHGSGDHSIATRALIITLRVVTRWKYTEIEAATGVAASCCSAIVR